LLSGLSVGGDKIPREINPEVTIIIGGPHATYYTQECIAQGFDAVCMGDGERIFEAILQGDDETLNSLKHPYSTQATRVFCDRLSEEEMNSYPIPIRDIRYLGRYQYVLKDRLGTTLVNSRGCPMRCAFCESGLEKSGRWFTPEHFRKELLSICSLGYRGVMIFDDLFALSPKKVKPYLDVLKEFEGMTFRCFGHARIVAKYPEIIDMLAGAGCVEMGFGAESASQKVLDNIEKRTKVADLHNFVESVIGAGINVKAFFMMGLPGETPVDFQQTLDFVGHYRAKYPDSFNFDMAVLFPYKGTKIGNIIRLGEGDSLRLHNHAYNREDVALRIRPGLTWAEVDSGMAGAYKQRRGASDIVLEPYDWDTNTVLFPAEQIEELQKEATRISARYANHQGNPIAAPVEGTIGAIVIENPVVEDDMFSLSQIEAFLKGVDGWLTPDEGRKLYHLAQGCRGDGVIVEIGSWKGKSTIWLAHGTKAGKHIKIYAIDPHTGSPQTAIAYAPHYTYPEFMANIKSAGVSDIVTPLIMTSEEAAENFQESVALVFIDGDHDYEMVKLDFELWFPKLAIGGIMVFHDVHDGWPGPRQVVEECVRGSEHFVNVTDFGSMVFATKVSDERDSDYLPD